MDVSCFQVDNPGVQIVSHYSHFSELRFDIEAVRPCYSIHNTHPCHAHDSVSYPDHEALVAVPEGNSDPLHIRLGLCGGHEKFYLSHVVLHADVMLESVSQRSSINIQLPDVPDLLGMLCHLELREDVARRFHPVE